MRVDWQQATALAIVAITALAMGAGWWRARRRRSSGGCPGGCCEEASRPPSGRLILTARKGERPVLRVEEK